MLTRLAVTYDLLPLEAIEAIVRLAHDKGALVYVDDAGGARVGPAAFGQPRTLELGVDTISTATRQISISRITPGTVAELCFGLLDRVTQRRPNPRWSRSYWQVQIR